MEGKGKFEDIISIKKKFAIPKSIRNFKLIVSSSKYTFKTAKKDSFLGEGGTAPETDIRISSGVVRSDFKCIAGSGLLPRLSRR